MNLQHAWKLRMFNTLDGETILPDHQPDLCCSLPYTNTAPLSHLQLDSAHFGKTIFNIHDVVKSVATGSNQYIWGGPPFTVRPSV